MKMNYWNRNGKHQDEYDKLYDELVPDSGNADTLEGELLRASSKLYYRYFNDGDMVSECMEEYMKDSSALSAFGFLYNQSETYIKAKELLTASCEIEYENKLEEFANFVIELILSKNGNYHKANLNMLDKEFVENLPVDFYEEEEEEY